jgi:hypothetical protein
MAAKPNRNKKIQSNSIGYKKKENIKFTLYRETEIEQNIEF